MKRDFLSIILGWNVWILLVLSGFHVYNFIFYFFLVKALFILFMLLRQSRWLSIAFKVDCGWVFFLSSTFCLIFSSLWPGKSNRGDVSIFAKSFKRLSYCLMPSMHHTNVKVKLVIYTYLMSCSLFRDS